MRKAFTVSVSAGLLSVAFVAQAETVLWYRFEEGTPGTQMTTATKVVNTAKPGIYEGEAWAHRSGNSCSKDAAYQKYFPYYSAAMGPDFVVYDPVSGELSFINNRPFPGGCGSCHAAISNNGRFIIVPHYYSGNIFVWRMPPRTARVSAVTCVSRTGTSTSTR